MMRGLIAKKLGMSQIFDENGSVIPVTILQAGPCCITQIKTLDNDGYDAVQIAYGDKKEKNTNKPLEGHFKKAGVTPKKFLVEFDIVPGFDYEMGQVFNASIFKQGDSVKVTGTSKGRGFSGVMKRHGFGGGPKTHGQREHPRSAGSIGQASDPSRVFKGVKMPGQYGNKKMTVENLKVVKIDTKNNHIFVKGAVPGSNNGMVIVNK
ncbi:MAG: 50S ribosomal protein L3 [Candidatus Marinimicrobia bacterium]|nr:50S ribosomal protein L3 [Candidatus Neomarinimicrobiota bacterium]